MAGFRAAPIALVPDGQSENGAPVRDVDTWAIRFCTDNGLPRPADVWRPGLAWVDSLASQERRVRPYAHAGLFTIYAMVGGTSDFLFSNRTGAQVYEDMVTLATNARSWGFDSIIATTTLPSTFFSDPQDAERIEGNGLILADAEDAFDQVIDFANTPGLDDPEDTDFYPDGLHWSALAAQVAADTFAPILP